MTTELRPSVRATYDSRETGPRYHVTATINDVDGEHIAHNDPAAVLRLVAAVREILAMHEPTPDGDCSTCLESESDIYGRTYERAPCYHLQLLARGLGINPETETP